MGVVPTFRRASKRGPDSGRELVTVTHPPPPTARRYCPSSRGRTFRRELTVNTRASEALTAGERSRAMGAVGSK